MPKQRHSSDQGRSNQPSRDQPERRRFAKAEADPWERRDSPRRVALEFRSWVGWWTDDRHFTTLASRVMDISRGGAAVETTEPLARGRSVLLGVHGMSPIDGGVWATVVGIGRGSRGSHLIHLAFAETCPEPLYRAILDGLKEGRPRKPK